MKVVGRSGAVMDLPEQLARAMIRNGSVEPAGESEQVAAPASSLTEPVVIVADYADAGRTTQPQPEQPPAKASAADVRAWAAAEGIECPAKGRVSLKVVQAYIQAHREG